VEGRMEHMKKRWFLWGLLLLIGLSLFVYLISSIGLHVLIEYIYHIDIKLLLVAIGVYLLIVFSRAGKWYLLSRYHSIPLPYSYFMGSYFVYSFISSLTPFRSGDLFAPFILSKNGKQRYQLYQSLIVDRLIEILVLIGLTIFTSWYLFHHFYINMYSQYLYFILIVLICVGIIFTVIKFKIFHKVKTLIKDAFYFYMGLSKTIILTHMGINGLVWFLDFSYVYIIMKSVGLDQLVLLHSIVSQVGSTVFSMLTFVPSGIGTGAVSYVYLGQLFHYQKELLVIGTVLAKTIFLFLMLFLALLGYVIVSMHKKRNEYQ
jgi:uncharacterized membrane protein YbhN (UPF0104 family)